MCNSVLYHCLPWEGFLWLSKIDVNIHKFSTDSFLIMETAPLSSHVSYNPFPTVNNNTTLLTTESHRKSLFIPLPRMILLPNSKQNHIVSLWVYPQHSDSVITYQISHWDVNAGCQPFLCDWPCDLVFRFLMTCITLFQGTLSFNLLKPRSNRKCIPE